MPPDRGAVVVGRVTNFAPSASARRGGSTLRGAVARGVVVRRRDCKRSVRLGALGPDAVEALTQLAPHVEAASTLAAQRVAEISDAAATIDIDPTVAASSFADALEAVNGAPPAEEVATGAQRMEGILSPISDTLEAFVLGTQDLFKEKGVPYPLGSAIIFTTFCVKALTYPFTKTQVEATLNIQNLAPQTEAIRERYKNDTERMNIEINRLYEENQVSPLAGCVPILLTLPVVWGLYRAFNNASIDGSFDEPWFFIPSLAGPSPERNLDWLFPLDASNDAARHRHRRRHRERRVRVWPRVCIRVTIVDISGSISRSFRMVPSAGQSKCGTGVSQTNSLMLLCVLGTACQPRSRAAAQLPGNPKTSATTPGAVRTWTPP